MRRVKDTLEIERLREAGRIGALGFREAIRSTRPGLFEYQLSALAEFAFLWNGSAGFAFFPIVGSGPNSCIVHYSENRRKMAAGDVVVMDYGPDYKYYGADITRTFPVSGKFSQEQAKVYQAVLDTQKAVLEKIRPGATFDDLETAAHDTLKRFGYDKYFGHLVSHYVGMSIHDVGNSKPFQAGVVIAVEPGVYLNDRNLGVRIEDTVLVTKDGYEILTKDAPKEILEIEKLMSERGIPEAIESINRQP
jgi:Xaa-Pro aminopeptidase